MLRAEWENWLLDENTRCKQVQMILQEDRRHISPTKKVKGVDPQIMLDTMDEGERERLKRWQKEYCASCQREQEAFTRK
jgi:hypothetical protein